MAFVVIGGLRVKFVSFFREGEKKKDDDEDIDWGSLKPGRITYIMSLWI